MENKATDAELLKRVQTGDIGALPILSERYHSTVIKVAVHLAGGRSNYNFKPALVSTLVAFNDIAASCEEVEKFAETIEKQLMAKALFIYDKSGKLKNMPLDELEKKAAKGDSVAMCILMRRKNGGEAPKDSFIMGGSLMDNPPKKRFPGFIDKAVKKVKRNLKAAWEESLNTPPKDNFILGEGLCAKLEQKTRPKRKK